MQPANPPEVPLHDAPPGPPPFDHAPKTGRFVRFLDEHFAVWSIDRIEVIQVVTRFQTSLTNCEDDGPIMSILYRFGSRSSIRFADNDDLADAADLINYGRPQDDRKD